MSANPSTEELRVLRAIEILEEGKISYLNFDFIEDREIAQFLKMHPKNVEPILSSLSQRRMIMMIRGLDAIRVRSKIGNLIYNLYKLKTRSRTGEPEINTADIKYIRHEKKRPIRNIPLRTILQDKSISNSLGYQDNNETHNVLLKNCVNKLAATDYPSISLFQQNAIREILEKISMGKTSAEGLGIVADTGTGKSAAYQIPLILWILHKKCNLYFSLKNKGVKIPKGTCTALLLFPRNVLNQDQETTFHKIAGIANDVIQNLPFQDSEFQQLMNVKIASDYGGIIASKLPDHYQFEKHDVIFTNTDTLKKRLYNPICHHTYQYGIDLVLMDEIHLTDGLQGAYASGLFKRLSNLLKHYNKLPLFVGMSATVNAPEKHCKKLFGLTNDVKIVSDIDDPKQPSFVEHHIMLKPVLGRHPTGILVDAVSCLIHNRRALTHTRGNHAVIIQPMKNQIRDYAKTITFVDSKGGVYRTADNLNNIEIFQFPNVTPPIEYNREYGGRFNPRGETTCSDCKNNMCIADNCEEYENGNCWFFSENSGDPDGNRWTTTPEPDIQFPPDNIRSMGLTGSKWKEKQKYVSKPDEIFIKDNEQALVNRTRVNTRLTTELDNIVATSVFEVGVDFGKIQEITIGGALRSPASYKQRSGRGARNGKRDVEENGLVVLSIIEPDPISNFFFKHLDRLVFPQLDPLKLETNNPNVVKAQCFSAIFDFFATKDNIDLFNTKDPSTHTLDSQRIIDQYKNAKQLLQNNKSELTDYLKKFLQNINVDTNEIINESCKSAEELLEKLSKDVTIENESKTVAQWIAEASQKNSGKSGVESLHKFIGEPSTSKQENTVKIEEQKQQLYKKFQSVLTKPYCQEKQDELKQFFDEWYDEL